MYPKNAASPEPVAIGAVVQISDGAVQTSGCTVRIKPIGVAEADGGGTTAYSTDGIVLYTPTQAETNYTSFILIAKKTGCIPVSITVVTTSSATPGTVLLAPVTHTSAVVPTVTTLTGHTPQTGDTYALANGPAGFVAIDTVVDAILADTGTDGVVVAAGSKTGYTLTATTGLGNQTANITGTITTVTTATNLTNLPTIPANWITAAGINASAFTAAKFDTACLTAAKFDTGAITATTVADGFITNAKFAAGAIDNAAIAADAIGSSELAATAVSEIADQVWDELLSGHVVAGSAGEALAAATAPSAAAVADAVWDEALAGHLSAGSTGEALNAAGSAGDPWTTTLPGAYTGSQAGKILADVLDDTGTTLQAELDGIQADTEDIQTRLPAALVSGRIDASVGAMAANTLTASALATDAVTEIQSGLATPTNITAATGVTVSAIGANVVTAAALAADAVTEIQSGLSTLDAGGVRTAVGLASANLDTQLSAIVADTNELQVDWVDGGRLDLLIDAIKTKTDNLPAAPAATGDIPTVSQIWTTALTEAYRATGATGTAAQLLYEVLQNITEFTITSTTKTVKKLDGTTTAKTYTLNDGTTPTGITETT